MNVIYPARILVYRVIAGKEAVFLKYFLEVDRHASYIVLGQDVNLHEKGYTLQHHIIMMSLSRITEGTMQLLGLLVEQGVITPFKEVDPMHLVNFINQEQFEVMV